MHGFTSSEEEVLFRHVLQWERGRRRAALLLLLATASLKSCTAELPAAKNLWLWGERAYCFPCKGSEDCLTVPPSDACHNSTPGQGALPASRREPRAMGHPVTGMICLAWAKAAWRVGCLRRRKQSYLLARCTCLQLEGGIPFKYLCMWLRSVTRFWERWFSA